MDRNFTTRTKTPIGCVSLSARRAWIEIDIDNKFGGLMSSLSARRAWIEITVPNVPIDCLGSSLSARRAWIEMPLIVGYSRCDRVALRKESVDRNRLGGLVD